MSSTSAHILEERAVPDWLRYCFVAAFVFFGCWGITISYWRKTGSNPASGEIALMLLGLPLGLLLAGFIAYKTVTRYRAAAPAAASTSAPAQAAVPANTAPLAVLAASVRSPHGSSPEELAIAIRENRARTDLDKDLVDDDGFPIMAARSDEAWDDIFQEEVGEWLTANGMAGLHLSDEQWRALTLANAVTGELAARAADIYLSSATAPFMLQLVPMLPIDWPHPLRRAVAMWLKHTAVQYGWPADRIVLSDDAPDPAAASPSAVIKSLLSKAATREVPMIAMVVACASHIGEETVSQWSANHSLFTASQPQGRIPGEGAAGLLITDLHHAQSIDTAAFVLLDEVEEARLAVSADESRRADTTLLGDLTERALKRASAASSDIKMVIADTDLRSNRMLELMGHVSAALPQLDAGEEVVRVGVANGSAGPVSFMTSLALARYYVLELDAPVLCIGNEDAYRREVALVRSPVTSV